MRRGSPIIAITILLTVCLGILFSTAIILFAAPSLRSSEPTSQGLFQGIAYERLIQKAPRPAVIHIATVDLRQAGVSFLVTPGNPDTEFPLKARTTTQFLKEFDLQLALNGDGFHPWFANGPFDYYPHSGDPVAPLGFAASRGQVYAPAAPEQPVMYISRNNQVLFNNPPNKPYNALSGNMILVDKGKPAQALASAPETQQITPQPRTAIGVDKRGKYMYIVVVDGRQPGYSEGVTLNELAIILIELGAHFAINMDGGGSSTLVAENANGAADVLNSPIHSRIPGKQRPVGNHLGIYARPLN